MPNDETPIDNLEQYRIRSRREIIRLLDSIKNQRELVKMSGSEAPDAILTSILAIEEGEDCMVVDAAPMQTQNHRLLSSERISFETKLDQVRVMFSTDKAEFCKYEDYSALRVPLPESAIRIQRRDSYRVNIPLASPVQCTFPPPGSEEKPIIKPVALTMLNVSMGGIAVADENNVLDGTLGILYKNCSIALLGTSVTVSLEIRNVASIKLPNGKAIRHIGCRFTNTSNSVLTLVQRYILKLERDQNAKMTGFR